MDLGSVTIKSGQKATSPTFDSSPAMERPEKASGWEEVKKAEDRDALFADVSSDSPITEIESLCMACGEQVRSL